MGLHKRNYAGLNDFQHFGICHSILFNCPTFSFNKNAKPIDYIATYALYRHFFFNFTTCRLMKSSTISSRFYKLYVYIFTFILRISILTLYWLRLSEISFGPWIWRTKDIAMFGIEASLYINFSGSTKIHNKIFGCLRRIIG